jgi:hypothetical protein
VNASLAGYVSVRKIALDDEAVINLDRAAKLRIKFELPKGASPPPWYRVWIGRYDAVADAVPQPVPLAIEDLQSGPVPEASRWFQSRSWTGELSVQANPGHNLLVLVAPGFCVHTFAISARPGDEVDLGTLYMRTAGELKGNVVTEEGSPIADAEVATWGGFRPPWADVLVTRVARTDGSGAFRLPLLTPYDDPPLLVCAPGFPRTVTPSDWDPVRNPAGGGAGIPRREERTATLQRGSAFSGRVTGARPGVPLFVRFLTRGASVYAEVGPDGLYSTVVPESVESVMLVDGRGGARSGWRIASEPERRIDFNADP